jgi:hypothetical protein
MFIGSGLHASVGHVDSFRERIMQEIDVKMDNVKEGDILENLLELQKD